MATKTNPSRKVKTEKIEDSEIQAEVEVGEDEGAKSDGARTNR